MKKIIVILMIVLIIGGGVFFYMRKHSKRELKETKDVVVVPTMENKIASDSSYCATFQLIWNDLKNDLVKTDIKFMTSNDFVTALNKETFTENDISEDLYYKVYGLKTLALKKEIEDAIWAKFKQKSDILDKFSWEEEDLDQGLKDIQRYFFYTMLYKEFSYKYAFDILNNGEFNEKYDDVKYFGITSSSNSKLYKQVKVLYYNDSDDFAVSILTEEDDEIIFNVNPKGNSFKEIYENILDNQKKYQGSSSFKSGDTLRIPYLDFNVLKEYTELENQPFYDLEGNVYEIVKALQSIQFEIDEKGGKIKSEAAMDVFKATAVYHEEEPRYFEVNKTFAIFLKEVDKEKPYFASRVDDITKFQQ